MKIKDVTRKMEIQNPYREINKKSIAQMDEDGVTVAGVSGDKAKLSNGQEVDAKLLTPDTQHPGQFTMPEMDPAAIKPGSVVNTGDEQQTSEEVDEATGWSNMQPEAAHQMMGAYNELAPHIEKYQDAEGAHNLYQKLKAIAQEYNAIPALKSLLVTAKHSAHQEYDTNPQGFENWFWFVGDMLKHVSKSEAEAGGIEVGEEQDTIASGNHDVGGDATDKFIDQIKDKGFEKTNRPQQGARSSLPESDELMKWLTIAGIK